MSVWRLKSLELQNFRSFKKERIDFPESGLVLIRGVSGAGKSTIFLAIAYALDILPQGFAAADFQNWDEDKDFQVVLTLNDGTQDLVIARGKKNAVKLGDEAPVTGSKSIGAEMARVLGFSPEIVKSMTYRPQGDDGLFLGASPSDKNSFLVSVLGLGQIEEALEAAEQKRMKFLGQEATAIAVLGGRLETLEQTKAEKPEMPEGGVEVGIEFSNRIADCKTKVEFAKGVVDAAFDAIADKNDDNKRLVEEETAVLRQKLEQANKFLVQVSAEDTAKAEVLRKRSVELSKMISAANQKAEDVRRKEEKIANDLKRASTLRQGRCDLCNQPWKASVDEARRLEQEAELVRVALPDKVVIGSQIDDLALELSSLKFVPDPRLQKLQDAIRAIEVDIAKVVNRPIPGLEELRQNYQKAQNALQEAKSQLQNAESNYKFETFRRETAWKENVAWNKRLAEAEAAVARTQADLAKARVDLAAEKDFIHCMGREGFLGAIFSDILQEITVEANKRLSQLSNVSSVTVELGTEIERGRRQITAGIFVRGHRAKFTSGLSGGMQTSVAQVTDLAVMDVIARRTGKSLGWICLDEVFDGQGFATKESAHELLREYAKDRLVLVIDHGTEMGEAFTGKINVDIQNGVSTISHG